MNHDNYRRNKAMGILAGLFVVMGLYSLFVWLFGFWPFF